MTKSGPDRLQWSKPITRQLKGADPVAGVEMASTGEVACLGNYLEEAFYNAWLATEQYLTGRNIFLSLADEQKFKFVEEAGLLVKAGWTLYATEGTYNYLKQFGITSKKTYKIRDKKSPNIARMIEQQKINLVVSIPSVMVTHNFKT